MTPENIDQILQESYLGLGDTRDLKIKNVLTSDRDDWEINNPILELTKHMRHPDNFSWTCKHLLNIDLLPFQAVILKELWTKIHWTGLATIRKKWEI